MEDVYHLIISNQYSNLFYNYYYKI